MLSVPPPLLGASGGWGRDGEGVMPQATHFDGLLLSGLGCWLGRGPSEQATNRAGEFLLNGHGGGKISSSPAQLSAGGADDR
jgi:hypothetical protein